MNSQQGPDADISRAVRVLMDASPEFRAALEKAVQKLAEAMEALDTPEMRKALENAGAKVAEFEQANAVMARFNAAGIHLVSIDPPVEPDTGPKAEEQTPEYIRARQALRNQTATTEEHQP